MSNVLRQSRTDAQTMGGERQQVEAPSPSRGPINRATAQLSGRWQIPLLAFALSLLVVGIWRMRPEPQPPAFEDLFANAVTLKEAQLYTEASAFIESLLNEPGRTPDQRRRLHRLMVEVIFNREAANVVHGPENPQRLLEHSERARAEGEPFDPEMHRMRALAREWLGQPGEAVAEYREALAKVIAQPWEIRRRMIQLRRMNGDIGDDELHQEFDTFVDGEEVPIELRFWAAEKKIALYAAGSKHEEAERFLAAHVLLFQDTAWWKEYDFLRALAWYHVGRRTEAERLLRALRDQLVPGDPLFVRTGWLFGRLLLEQGAPEPALALFDEVLRESVPGDHRAVCVLGRAEALADLERFDGSIHAYDEAIRLTTEDPGSAEIDLQDIRESTTAWYQALHATGRLPEAMAYLKIAARLAPPVDNRLQTVYSQRLADLAYQLGLEAQERAGDADAAAARRYLVEAGEEYLRLARLSVFNTAAVVEAYWRAQDAFDRAGERRRLIQVLETFVREYPESSRVPEALLQLGRAHQVGGDLTNALACYQRNLIQFPRTPAAIGSLIPLADCFRDLNQTDKAEQTLLRIVSRPPGDTLAAITPEAEEYRDALFRLGELYTAAGDSEKAITRYEEALERYPNDPRTDAASFQLADAYRKSAARIREDLADDANIAYKDSLRLMHQNRLRRAHELFRQVLERYRRRPAGSFSELDRLYVKLSHLYMADTAYDQSLVGDVTSLEPYARAVEMYEKAALVYQQDPIAMSAYVQMINCYVRMGKVSDAWMTLQRARWVLRNIPDDVFLEFAPQEDRAFWDKYLTWLEGKPTFAALASARPK